MPITSFDYEPYHRLDGRPHVIVDGSPAAGTTLLLTHWPGFPARKGTEADLSAQMAFRYLRLDHELHGDARLVSNNHFDQDGLVSVFALTQPEAALEREEMLVELAAAGDFATYRVRDAARLSMVIATLSRPDRSPLPLPSDDDERIGYLYEELTGRLPELVDDVDAVRDLWAEEDAALTASEKLFASGRITIEERPELDLSIVDLPVDLDVGAGGHRFAHRWATGLHPMALHDAVQGFTVLVRQGRRTELTYQYESWVQYRSRPVRARRDLSVLASELSKDEPGDAAWRYEGSSELAPRMLLEGAEESAIESDELLRRIEAFLATAPPDFDPYSPS